MDSDAHPTNGPAATPAEAADRRVAARGEPRQDLTGRGGRDVAESPVSFSSEAPEVGRVVPNAP